LASRAICRLDALTESRKSFSVSPYLPPPFTNSHSLE
jgi:hypothetical protein